MKKRTLLFLICFFVVCEKTIAQVDNISLKETKKGVTDKPVKKIMILGIGSTPTRIFLERLSESLITRLKKQNIESEFEYLGKEDIIDSAVLNSIKYKNFSSFLIFEPVGSSRYNGVTTGNTGSVSTSVGNIGYTLLSSGFSYYQKFEMKICNASNCSNPYWNANFTMDGDISRSSLYPKISLMIFTAFIRNKYILIK